MVIYNSYDERVEIHENDIIEYTIPLFIRKINSALLFE